MTDRPSLAAALITRNAGPRFERCLDSLRWVDEIVVLDSGSSDDTVEIARRAGARVTVREDWEGFGVQRRRAQSLVASDWILWVDSDEIVTDELRDAIQAVMARPDPELAYSVNRMSDFFGRFITTSGWYPDRVVRLHARDRYRYNDAVVHEALECPRQCVRRLPGHLLHYTTDDVDAYLGKSLDYARTWARERHEQGRRVGPLGVLGRTAACFLRKYVFQRGFMEGGHGLLLALQSSQYVFTKYFTLWALGREAGRRRD